MADGLKIYEVARRTFDFVVRRQTNYQLAFNSPAGKAVLKDLARFCRATKPVWSDDQRHHARLTGRNEVFHRIAQNLHMTPEQLYTLYGGPQTEEDQ